MNVIELQIADLRAHPKQATIYGDLPQQEYEALRDDIARRGIQQPIIVTADGIIVDGHQRVRACSELGIAKIAATICTAQTEDEVEETFLLQNLIRRQLNPIAMAIAFKALIEIERRRCMTDESDYEGDLRDILAKRLGGNMSGRTIDRYLQLLRLPPVIRRAVSAGAVSMAKALLIERFGHEAQLKIADRISKGEPISQILLDFFPKRNRSEQKDQQTETPSDLYMMLFEFLAENLSLLDGDGADFVGQAGDHDRTIAVLDAAANFCSRMTKLERAAQRQSLRKIQHLLQTTQPDSVSG